MNSQQDSISGQSIALFLGGILIIVGVIAYLVLGGTAGIKEKLQPLVNQIKENAEPSPIPLPNDMAPYTDGKIYTNPNDPSKLDVKQKADEYGGVKVNMENKDEKIESISTYPVPTIDPWEPGGKDWQKEYWNTP
jgi:uncharacterized membrane protein